MDNFLAAVDTRQGIKIIISGEPVWIARRRLLAHLQLSDLSVKISQDKEPIRAAAYLIEYLALAGLSDKQIKEASVYELLEAFFALQQLNTWQWILPWLDNPEIDPTYQPEPYEYSGRRWAVWIHRLGSRYGWSPETIWNLWPEEAAAYIQEIMLSEYYEREDRRALSKLSYEYNKSTQTYKYRPAPMYSWMVDEGPPELVRIPRNILPVGNIIKMDEEVE
jgi:hypothetical protein